MLKKAEGSKMMVIKTLVIRVVEFSSGGYKIRKIFAEKSTYPKEIIKFWGKSKNWASF